jgi:hypothetical protein
MAMVEVKYSSYLGRAGVWEKDSGEQEEKAGSSLAVAFAPDCARNDNF